MVYCAAFYCNANSSQNKATRSWFKFPTEPALFFLKQTSMPPFDLPPFVLDTFCALALTSESVFLT